MTIESINKSEAYLNNEVILRESPERLREIFERQRVVEKTKNYNIASWKRWRENRLEKYGEDSLVTLFPETSYRLHDIVSEGFEKLEDRGIHTKEELLMFNVDKLRATSSHGMQAVELIKAMHDYALAEFHLKWSV
ncbi:hypothetical protein A2715_05440 [Candidatus Woesebacteria bacterium RIFCSPHIGHO2_01_FULL_39_32]|uniref:Uncharacterized protein n=1 Tax=Candidatus Woesebacteria bacterium RIFCSPLOWO2_01_FULL_39_25 TaxID=1802521 RepID=A0A1F8BLQ0_9BACT|nr:MAG: hypothetical protein A2124_03880 [Candidatus Woesebacteria bacterium GWB1_37_5]OGM25463.1 MAG: hypothetical protein A2715_05440 [Candidatus Woesebacteria bacterium RIFCSPHIGHO2_01_FULL_39_32]OGM38566.1 MAG: hypothetical protein A3F01_04395 [Candidatus Woesebacteria bacterium RIFCSPHIGHO2_12_FULL_38_11]OGM64994.1 MAG: hypothetical protein A2893_05050 [Candidatus Woesebacteria bacterium RIFCSPLOWO2_01_FULL_39_25]